MLRNPARSRPGEAGRARRPRTNEQAGPAPRGGNNISNLIGAHGNQLDDEEFSARSSALRVHLLSAKLASSATAELPACGRPATCSAPTTAHSDEMCPPVEPACRPVHTNCTYKSDKSRKRD